MPKTVRIRAERPATPAPASVPTVPALVPGAVVITTPEALRALAAELLREMAPPAPLVDGGGEWMTTPLAAAYVGAANTGTLVSLRARGLRAYKVPGSRAFVYRRADLDAFMSANAVAASDGEEA